MVSKITPFPAGRAGAGGVQKTTLVSPARRWGTCGSVMPQETIVRDGSLGFISWSVQFLAV